MFGGRGATAREAVGKGADVGKGVGESAVGTGGEVGIGVGRKFGARFVGATALFLGTVGRGADAGMALVVRSVGSTASIVGDGAGVSKPASNTAFTVAKMSGAGVEGGTEVHPAITMSSIRLRIAALIWGIISAGWILLGKPPVA